MANVINIQKKGGEQSVPGVTVRGRVMGWKKKMKGTTYQKE